MSRWEQKKADMERRIERGSRIFMSVCVMSAVVSVVLAVLGGRYANNKEYEDMYKLFKEVKQEQQRQR